MSDDENPKKQLIETFQKIGVANYGNDVSGEIEFLGEILKGAQSPLVLDIGANRGWYSEEVLRVCPSAQLFSFEPHPVSYGMLKARSERLGFTAINAGCGSENKQATIYDDAKDDGSEQASLIENVITGIYNYESVAHETKIIRLDDFLKEIGAEEVYFAKVDVEGFEYDVFIGMGDYLTEKKISIIQFEFSETQLYSKHFFKDFFDLFSEKYNMYRLMKNGLFAIDKYEPLFCEVFAYQNIVCIKK